MNDEKQYGCVHGWHNPDYCPSCQAESDAVYLRAENLRLRDAVNKFLAASGHDLCHENRKELAAAFGLDFVFPSLPPEQEFAEQCIAYRLSLYGHDGPKSETEVWENKIRFLEAEVARLKEQLDKLRNDWGLLDL